MNNNLFASNFFFETSPRVATFEFGKRLEVDMRKEDEEFSIQMDELEIREAVNLKIVSHIDKLEELRNSIVTEKSY